MIRVNGEFQKKSFLALLLGLCGMLSNLADGRAEAITIQGFAGINGVRDFEFHENCFAASVTGQASSLAQLSEYRFFECDTGGRCTPVTTTQPFSTVDADSEGRLIGASDDGVFAIEGCGRAVRKLSNASESCRPIASVARSKDSTVVAGGPEQTGCLDIVSPRAKQINVTTPGITNLSMSSGWALAFGHLGGSSQSVLRVDIDGRVPIIDVLSEQFIRQASRQKLFINKIAGAKDEFWIATRDGLLRYDPIANKLSKILIPGDAQEITAMSFTNEALWIGATLRRNPRMRGGAENILESVVFEVRFAGGGRPYRRCKVDHGGTITGAGRIGDYLVLAFDEKPYDSSPLEVVKVRDACKVIDSDVFIN